MSKPRILFGSDGWPCGMHEIATHAVRLGLAHAVIHELNDDFPRKLREFQPHVVGFRIEGGRLETVRRSIATVRRMVDAEIILGGPTATSHPIETLEETGADYVFAGDAEHSVAMFLEFARTTNSTDRLPEIPGLAYRWAGKATVNLPMEDPVSGTPVPCIDEKTLRENRLDWSLLEGFAKPFDSIYLTGGRGCPGRCSFCARLHGQHIRTKSAGQIAEELQGADRLVREGKLRLNRWPLYKDTDDPALRSGPVSWCSVFDEDFFLDRKRAAGFFQLFEFHGFSKRYRLGFQTNPRSLLGPDGRPDAEMFYWIGRVKAMIQLGAESFHPEMLHRWNKRHTAEQLETVLDALDRTGQDFNVFLLLSDYHSTVEEILESTKLLLDAARRHPRMRIASNPYMIPLYDSDVRRELGFLGRLKIERFTDHESPHPEWMAPEAADLADRIDEALQDALYPERRDRALEQVRHILNHFTKRSS